MATAKRGDEDVTPTVPEAAAPDVPADATGEDLSVSFVDALPDDTRDARRDTKYARAVAVLRENPGKWGKLISAKDRNSARTRCYQLRRSFKDDAELTFTYVGTDVYGGFQVPKPDAKAEAESK